MKRLLSTLARQIESVKNHAGLRGEEGAALDPILRSLRVSYVALSTGLDPWRDAHHLFLLRVSETGGHALIQAGRPVPVNPPYLAYVFWSAGVELAPGQLLLLEPELAKEVIEEALGRVALELAFAERERLLRRAGSEERGDELWERKIELVAASLLADEFLERSRVGDEPEEAA